MVKVNSKTKLPETLQKKVLTSLSEYLDRKISEDEVEFVLDEKIIAGIRVEVDSEVIDLTLNNRLEKIIEVLNENA